MYASRRGPAAGMGVAHVRCKRGTRAWPTQPGVVQIFDVQDTDSFVYIFLELCVSAVTGGRDARVRDGRLC